MKTAVDFRDGTTGSPSDCGAPLEIEVSSRNLGWRGLLVEKGWSPHFHPKDVVTPGFYFALGLDADLRWEAEIAGSSVELKTLPGFIWMNPPRSPFTHRVDEPCYFIILTVDEEVLFENFNGPLPKKDLQFLKSYNIDDAGLKGLIELFYRETLDGGKTGPAYHKALLASFSLYFIHNYSNYEDLAADRGGASRLEEKDLEVIDAYIAENIEGELRIGRLAEAVGMSKFFFLREFKKLTGDTPYHYVLRRKLEKAKELLRDPRSEIVEVAYRLGFSDQSHFTNLFRRTYGLSPGRYKTNR